MTSKIYGSREKRLLKFLVTDEDPKRVVSYHIDPEDKFQRGGGGGGQLNPPLYKNPGGGGAPPRKLTPPLYKHPWRQTKSDLG